MNLTDEDKQHLIEWGGKVGKSVGELEKELERLLTHDMIKINCKTEQEKILEGMRLLKARYFRNIMMSGNETEFQLMILGKSAIRTVKVDSRDNPGEKEDRAVMNMVAIGKKVAGGPYMQLRLAAWGDDIENTKVEPYTVYQANIKEKKGAGTEYTVTQSTRWVKQKTISKESAVALIRKTMTPLSYTKYVEAAGKNTEYLVEGTVMRHTTGKRADGSAWALYGIQPTDMEDMEVLMETQGLTVWVNQNQMKWGEDSVLMFIGRFNAPKEGRAVSMNADTVIPVIEYKLEGEAVQTEITPQPEPQPEPQPVVNIVQKPTTPTPTPKPFGGTKEEIAKKITNIKIIKEEDPDPFGPN
jgi:hypothetical protein